MRHERKDETDKTFGYLYVVRFARVDRWGAAVWSCRCVCGRLVEATGGDLRRGHTVSCGCKRHLNFEKKGGRK